MDNNIKKRIKESFMSVQFIIIAVITIASIVLYFTTDMNYLLYVIICGVGLIILYIIGFFRNIAMDKHALKIKEGNVKYNPYVVDKTTFINECKNGLMYSIIRVNNNIYEIEVQIDNSDNYDQFICYINDNEIIGLDNFLNFKLDNNYSLNDLNSIEFLEYNNTDPKKYFVDKII